MTSPTSVPVGYTQPPRDFFAREVLEVAPELLGGVLERSSPEGTVGMLVTEVEAYAGGRDPGSHSYRGKTARNATMFGPAGHLYSYFTYGMHHAINLVAGEAGQPHACLIRAGRIIEGVELARRRRTGGRRMSELTDRDLARGPGNVAQAFGATLADDGADLFDGPWRFLLPDAMLTPPIATGPRVGVSGPGGDGANFPWRYWIAGDPTVSVYRPAKPRRRPPG